MKRSVRFCILCALLPCGPVWADVMSGASYTLRAGTPAAGGGSASSASFAQGALSGQSLVIGPATSSGVVVLGGFYYIPRGLKELLDKRNTCLVVNGAALLACFDGAGIWRSSDSGAHWTAAATQPADMQIRALVVHPSVSARRYAISHGGGVHVSGDGGANWSSCTNKNLDLQGTTLTIAANGRLYAGTEGGIYTSTNCATWTALNTGLTVDAQKPPLAIVVDPATPTTLYAGFDGTGVHVSTNSGTNWTAATNQPTNLKVTALTKRSGTPLYAGTYGGGVFKAASGTTAFAACATQPANANVLSLTIDTAGRLYAGTEAGVFVSADGCANWAALNNGLP